MHNDFLIGILAIPGDRGLHTLFILEVEALPVKFVAPAGPGIFILRQRALENFI
jgi:hypothetical protein